MRTARIIGTGIAATCCARLLLDKGWTVSMDEPAPSAAPALVLNSVTLELIELVFGDRERLFHDAHFLNGRVVRWGGPAADSYAPGFALTLPGNVLGERLWSGLKDRVSSSVSCAGDDGESDTGWTIYASRTGEVAADGVRRVPEHVGRRCALTSTVKLRNAVDPSQYWIESTSEGWLFLAPLNNHLATLQVVVPQPPQGRLETLSRVLAKSTLIADLIEQTHEAAEMFTSAPCRLQQLNGPRWLAAGGAAYSYDPLCGDGTGYAIRGAILASAVLETLEGPATRTDCLAYYQARLNSAFYAHLEACYAFYSAAQFNQSWHDEIKMTEVAIRQLGQCLVEPANFRYSLRGFELIHYEAAKRSAGSRLSMSV